MAHDISDAHILLSMTYVSRANKEMEIEEIREILKEAERNNTANAITGMLIYKDNIFLQTIEGSRSRINRLLHNLIDDDRHHDLQVLEARELTHREWAKWSMNYAAPTEKTASIYLKYSTTTEFNPYLLSFNSIRGLMNELMEEQSQHHNQK